MLEHPLEPVCLPREQNAGLDNQQATLEDLAWLAGIVDGEGYIGMQLERIRRHSVVRRASVGLQISNTDEDIALKAVSIIKKIGVNPYLKVDSTALRKSSKKIVYVVSIHRMAVLLKVLKPILPYLTGNKKTRAELVIEFCESRERNYIRGSHTKNFYTDRELEIIDHCLPLQKRGAPETIRKAELEQSRFLRLKTESRRDKSSGRFCSYQDSEDRVQPSVKAQG
jgi:hypothetical protein